MNYYEHHLGDYMRDTAHLSCLEDGVYRRLLDAYYVRERALPADLKECCKLARATSKPERDAVAYVLREFFHLGEEGHHQDRADREIARYQDKQRKAKASADARWSQRQTHSEGNADASPNAMRTHSEGNADGMHRAPVPSHQTPNTKQTPVVLESESDNPAVGTPAGVVCSRLRAAGITGVNPSHAKLDAMLGAGYSVEEIASIGEEPTARGKGMAWVLATCEGRRRDAANVKPAPARSKQSVEERNQQVAEAWTPPELRAGARS